VPRVRPTPHPLRAGALLAIIMFAMPYAVAQISDPSDSFSVRAVIDGDPREPPRFRRARTLPQQAGPSRIGRVPKYGYQPGIGVGTSGFDSANRHSANAKGSQKAKAKTATAAKAKGAAAATARTPPPNSAAARLPQFQQRRGAPNAIVQAVTAETMAVLAAARRRLRLPEEDAFAPTGIQVGAFNVRPAVELTGGYDTNAARTSRAKPSWFEVVTPELLVNSNWTRHELTATLRGSYTAYQPASDLNRPSLEARMAGRFDISRDTYLNAEGHYLISTDRPGSPNIQADLARLPIAQTIGGFAGIGQRFNRLELTAKGLADRTVYEPSTFIDGQTETNDDRNYNRYGTVVRAAYELTPGMKPFVEGGADARVHDIAIDRFGMRRDSDGNYIKGGTTFEPSRILTGDIAVGWINRTYKDPTLKDVKGLTFDASLLWLASGLTTVKLTATTTVDESTVPGVSGVFSREVALQIDHAFRRWLIATLKFSVGFDDYVGSPRDDDRYALSAGIIYKLTREMQLRAEYRHEWRHSNQPGNDFVSDAVLVGMRLQR
jgi:hypothetical protein